MRGYRCLTHWGQVTHICVGKLKIVGSDNGFLPSWCQAIIWTNAGISLIGPLGLNFNEILIEIYIFSLKKMHLNMSSGNGGHFVLVSMCELYPVLFSGVSIQYHWWANKSFVLFVMSLQWRHNGRHNITNHQPHDYLLNRLFRCRSRKHQSFASLAFVRGIHWGTENSQHKWPVTWKMFTFDDVIMSKSH